MNSQSRASFRKNSRFAFETLKALGEKEAAMLWKIVALLEPDTA
jgi:hypothetical protein